MDICTHNGLIMEERRPAIPGIPSASVSRGSPLSQEAGVGDPLIERSRWRDATGRAGQGLDGLAGPGRSREEMFARHVGTKSAILLKRVRRLFCSPAAAPTNFHGCQGSYLDRFHEVCAPCGQSDNPDNVHGLVYCRIWGHAQAQPTMTLVHYWVLRKSVSAGSGSGPHETKTKGHVV